MCLVHFSLQHFYYIICMKIEKAVFWLNQTCLYFCFKSSTIFSAMGVAEAGF